ncbi:hypothetical protein HELRODRAFT_62983 [Helobdella robusta]|uniref:BRO1 domain-containing protein n=1 Tax=Helobdella robusta TaxID=6412 RepID=T1FX89_HELRO|nr:hypothetical protein HELRODRAFT_62983 [Helobdella robusta]ESO12822.1 hypothetical protein HELRODRAFT_62983 [Helobdella robusta]
MSSSEYFTIPLKKGTYVDLTRPITKYIDDVKVYGNSSDYQQALNELQRLRQEFIDRINEKNEKTLKSFYKYADQIVSLELKLPLAENQIRIKFKWQDAFPYLKSKTATALMLASGTYEKVCVLFNVASMATCVACQQKLDTDEGLKTAAKLYQQASGIFTYLQTIVPSVFTTTESTNDLQLETLSALASLTLAQAQDIFIKKAIQDSMKASLLSKLSQQCSLLYEETSKQMQSESLKSIFPKDFAGVSSVKQIVFQALAFYYDGLAYHEKKSFPEGLARLRQARDLMNKASVLLKPFPYAALQKLIENDVAKGEKDNSFIFHAIIPDGTKLPDVEKAVLAKPTPVENVKFSSDSVDLLERLLPLSVHQAVQKCEERRMSLVQTEIMKQREASNKLNNVLVTLNLPASIEDLSGAKLPKSLAEKSSKVRAMGGYQHLERIVNDLPTMLQKCKLILDESEKLLNEEESIDRQLRARYRHSWARSSSDALNRPMRDEIRKYRTAYNEALQADSVVRKRFATYRSAILLLSESDSDMERSLPPPNPAFANLANKKFVQDLQQLMVQVNQLKDERSKIEDKFKSTNIDFANKFMLAYKRDGAVYEESVSKSELDRVYGPLRELSAKNIATQDKLIKQIQLEEFKKQTSSTSSQRDAKLKELASAYDIFIELSATSDEGNKFYGDFTLLLEKFLTSIREFCAERNKEKDELMREMPEVPSQVPAVMAFHHAPPQTVCQCSFLFSFFRIFVQ